MALQHFLDIFFDILNENDFLNFSDIRTIENGYEVDLGPKFTYVIRVEQKTAEQ